MFIKLLQNKLQSKLKENESSSGINTTTSSRNIYNSNIIDAHMDIMDKSLEIGDAGIDDGKTVELSADLKPIVEVKEEQPTMRSCCICCEPFQADTDQYRLHLLAHLEVYEGKSVCPFCRINCTTNDKMVDHFLMVHGGVRKLVCSHPDCVRTCWTRRTMDRHEKRHISCSF